MPRRGRSYTTIDGITADRDAVPWYWRLVAIGSSFMILGGFLMLPATFDTTKDDTLRVSASAIGIFAVALLTAGFSLTALLCFAVRNPLFQADSLFLPSLTSCVLGLLTVFYDFLISSRYGWNTAALLVTVAAALSTIVYAALLIFTYRRISVVKSSAASVPLNPRPSSISSVGGGGAGSSFQGSSFYENYVRNMYPTSIRDPQPAVGYDPNSITEEEMQRQQMLMLLLQKEPQASPDPSASTFRLDWQPNDHEEGPLSPPANGYYAPNSAQSSAYPQTAYPGPPGLSRQLTGDLAQMRPWDGVWREPARARVPSGGEGHGIYGRAQSVESREERRREIEMGRR
jgi:hypothetical protein